VSFIPDGSLPAGKSTHTSQDIISQAIKKRNLNSKDVMEL
jgi:hypothetical protein